MRAGVSKSLTNSDATGLGLTGFTNPWVQIVGTANPNGGNYGETELNMTASSSDPVPTRYGDV
jgi:hypothetical protein